MIVVLALTCALLFGAADFVGGLAARRLSAIVVTGAGAVAGGVTLAIVLAATGGQWSVPAALLGAASGVAGAVAISLLYACLALGPMSILAPAMAVVSALVPVAAELLRGERLAPTAYLAAAIALVAAVLLGSVRGQRGLRASRRAVLMAVGAGAMIGVFLILIDLTPADSGVVPLVVNRATNATIMAVTLLVIGARRRVSIPEPARGPVDREAWRSGIRLAALGGVIDAIANTLTLLAIRIGDLTIVSVLIALSPAGTAILAAVVLRERVSRTQYAGIALALVGGTLFALR